MEKIGNFMLRNVEKSSCSSYQIFSFSQYGCSFGATREKVYKRIDMNTTHVYTFLQYFFIASNLGALNMVLGLHNFTIMFSIFFYR